MDQIRIVFLGTGAAAPTRQRNVSSLAAVLDGSVLLFDCGEGTQHQLMRSAVRTGAIEAIFITHLHGDHLFGLPGLMATLGLNARSAPLTIYGPKGLRAFLEAIPYPGTTFDIEVVEIDADVRPVELRKGNGYRVFAAPLHHSVLCFGYLVVEDDLPGSFNVEKARALGVPEGPLFGRLQRGFDVTIGGRTVRSEDIVGPRRRGRRIAFCTDTRPCDAAAELGRGADLFIHEATYANDHEREAVERFHSTAAEAARVAQQAAPRRLVLTHVSARYEDDLPLLDDARPIFPAVEVARDLLEIVVARRD